MDRDILIEQAYKKALEEKENNPETFELANQTLNNFEQSLLKWKQGDNIQFIENHILGDGPNSVSAIGMAKIAQQNFVSFIRHESTQEKLVQLILLKQQQTINKYQKVNKIQEIGLITTLERFQFQEGSKPRLLVNRLLIMMFPEVFTTIADTKKLDLTAECLGLNNIKSFEKKQIQIKDETDSYLEKIGQKGKVNPFFESVIGWWILPVKEMLLKQNQ